MNLKAIILGAILCALIPLFAASRWNPAVPRFLPEKIFPAVNLNAAGETETNAAAPMSAHMDVTTIAGVFSPPHPSTQAPVNRKPQKKSKPPRTNDDAGESSASDPTKSDENKRVYLGIIRDEHNIAHIFHRDTQSGALISVKEEP